MSFEPEWNVSNKDTDVVVLGLHADSIKEKIKTYVDTVGWNILLYSLIDLASNNETEIIDGLKSALQAYKEAHYA